MAQHIFTKCLRHPKMLLRKSVLLVSHNLQLLPHADKVVLLDDNSVAFVGPHDGFLELDNDLARQARSHKSHTAGRSQSGGMGQLYVERHWEPSFKKTSHHHADLPTGP